MLNLLSGLVLGLSVIAAQPEDGQQPPVDAPVTIAESSDFKATALHEQVMEFCAEIDGLSELVYLGELGRSFEDRSIPLLIIADPPVTSAAEASDSGKMVVFVFGNIHAGEVCGKEALMMFARELALTPDHPLLEELVIAIAPIYNTDGNEQVALDNRRGQVGPEEGMGQRANGQGLDLNRDYVKLESPEARAMLRFLNEWDPAIIIDTHTTNGSHHRYTLTYAGPKNPAGDVPIIEYVRNTFFKEVGQRVHEKYGWNTAQYGNFSGDRTRWTTYPALPRYGTPYRGLRNRIALLSEAYSYASYEDRINSTLDFVRESLAYAAENRAAIEKLISEADKAVVAAGRSPEPGDMVAIRSRPEAFEEKVEFLGFGERQEDGKTVRTDEHKTYELDLINNFVATAEVQRPFAYVIPAAFGTVIENLQRHGIEVDQLREDLELEVEVYTVNEIVRQERAFEGHHLVSLEVSSNTEPRQIQAGSMIVKTGQALGNLAIYLLEPHSDDGLATWNFFDDSLAQGSDFPVYRIIEPTPLTTIDALDVDQEPQPPEPITYENLYGKGKRPNLNGSPIRTSGWFDDGEHFLQVKERTLYKVHAATGQAERFFDPEPMAAALAQVPGMNEKLASSIAKRTRFTWNPDRTGVLITHEKDLYYATLDGQTAVRLTSSPQTEEAPAFSPDGRSVSFLKDNDLWVVDVATQLERQLTTGGTDTLRNGKTDWVYYEEIFGRGWRAYWWSPDSTHISFLQIDSSPIKRFTVVDNLPNRQRVEQVPYPKPGEPNPRARLGVVSAAGGSPRFAELNDYDEDTFLLTGVGWRPDSSEVFFYIQDRAQTWLDFMTVSKRGGVPKKLFRETTEAWVSRFADPVFLSDGSFLLLSERTGWKHVYHYEKNGELKAQLTEGEWEARVIRRLDEDGGWIYVTGTRDSHIAENLYRVKLDGSETVRLTQSVGHHTVSMSPKAAYYIDTWSNHQSPTQVALFAADGSMVRTLDTNPVRDLDKYVLGDLEQLQIETKDGFLLEGTLLKPANFDPTRQYPVWFMTYAGPHAPTVRDTWSSGRTWDQLLAQEGILVFRADPRSASGKGAVSAWHAYKRMGTPEMEDIAEAINWLSSQPYVDPDRIGMSGYSYGGFMTSFALTHSELFCAGIAGAPVTDWRDYDSIYTERYMDTPQNNPEGYDDTSVVKAAKDLHGRLLIVHGEIDDNVHLQNTLKLAAALQKANKDFEMMIYPGSRHGIRSPHFRKLQYDFIMEAMSPVGNLDSSDEYETEDQLLESGQGISGPRDGG